MTRAWDSRLLPALLALCAAVLALRTRTFGDYAQFVDPVRALLDLRVGDVGASAGVYVGSLTLRVLVVWPVAALGGGDLAVYRAGAAACLVATALIGWVVSRRAAGPRERLLLATCFVAVPALLGVLEFGHPEEALGGALCIAAVLAAGDGRATLAAVALGLALVNKPWALIAVPVVLAVAPAGSRLRIGAGAGALAAIVLVPFWALQSSDATHGVQAAATSAQQLWRPQQLLFWLGSAHTHVSGGVSYTGYRGPALVRTWIHPAIVALAPLLVIGLRARAGRPLTTAEGLGLLGVALLLRAALDPLNVTYYAVPGVLALAAWELLDRPGLPVLAALATAGTWLAFDGAQRADLAAWPRFGIYAAAILTVLAIAAQRLLAVTPPRRAGRRARRPDAAGLPHPT